MERILSIVKVLLNSDKPITVNDLANQLNVSNKTIRNDLKEVGQYFKGKQITLCKKPGIGISIEGDESKKLDLVNELKSLSNSIKALSPEVRTNYILKRLFASEENVAVKEEKRFEGKPILKIEIQKAIKNTKGVIEEAIKLV